MIRRPIINDVSQLEEFSRWRAYKRLYSKQNFNPNWVPITEKDKNKWAKQKRENENIFTRKFAPTCFLAFAKLMTDGSLIVKDFHELIAATFEDLAERIYPRAIISCPPRSGKSYLAALFIAWLIGRDQDAQHILASYGKMFTNKLKSAILSYISHPEFIKIFPKWSGFEPGTKDTFKSAGYMLSTSVGGPLTGFTAGTTYLRKGDYKDITSKDAHEWGVGAMLIDDPLKGSDSMAAFKTLDSWWSEQASTRRTNNWCQVVIATRFHKLDLHGLVIEKDGLWSEDNPNGWRWLNIQGLCESEATDILKRRNGESHWPDNPIFTPEMLLQQKRAMGANKFSALYQGNPVDAEGAIFKISLLKVEDKENLVPRSHFWIAADTAFEETQDADSSVITVLGHNPTVDQEVHVIEQISGKWDFPSLEYHIKATAKFYGCRTLVIEEKASGKSLLQVLKQSTKLNLVGMKALRDKAVRLQQVLSLFEDQRVIFHRGIWNDTVSEQLRSYPYCTHDDQLDSLVYGLMFFQLELDNAHRNLKDTALPEWVKNTMVKRRYDPNLFTEALTRPSFRVGNQRTQRDYSNF